MGDTRIKLIPYSDDRFMDFAEAVDEESVIPLRLDEPERVASLMEIMGDDKGMMRGIIDEDSGEFLGYCQVHDKQKPEWELGVTVLRRHQRKGVAYNALVKLMREASDEAGGRQFTARIDPDNLASIRLFQKLGATPREIKRGIWLFDDEAVARFEKGHLELIDDTVREMAVLFGVEPEKLLGRTLVFNVPMPE